MTVGEFLSWASLWQLFSCLVGSKTCHPIGFGLPDLCVQWSIQKVLYLDCLIQLGFSYHNDIWLGFSLRSPRLQVTFVWSETSDICVLIYIKNIFHFPFSLSVGHALVNIRVISPGIIPLCTWSYSVEGFCIDAQNVRLLQRWMHHAPFCFCCCLKCKMSAVPTLLI